MPRAAVALSVDPIAELRAYVELLERRIVVLEAERPRGARDAADQSLFVILHDVAEGTAFTSLEAMTLSQRCDALAAALLAADIVNQKMLGKLLGRFLGRTVDRDQLVRRKVRGCWRWQFVQVSHV